MSGFHRFLAALASVALLSACPGKEVVPPPGPEITLTASQPDVKADGKNVVTISVSREGTEPVTLTAAHGTWKDSGKATLTIASGNGDALLVTCDSRGLGGCSGLNKISATSADGAAGSMNGLNFLQLELCSNKKDDNADGKTDCADSDCVDTACTLPAGSTGEGHCDDVAAACVCNTGTSEICTDGLDNNCDGKVDCADTACASKTCRLSTGNAGICTNSVCTCAAVHEDDTNCNDGLDNDCDGNIDCSDSDCRPTTSWERTARPAR